MCVCVPLNSALLLKMIVHCHSSFFLKGGLLQNGRPFHYNTFFWLSKSRKYKKNPNTTNSIRLFNTLFSFIKLPPSIHTGLR